VSKISFIARIGWEAVLLLAAIVVLALGVAEGHFFGGGGPWPDLAVLGLLAAGIALSLRTGTPNLAVAAVAPFAGLLYVQLVTAGHLGAVPAAVVTVLATLGLGLVLALVTGLTGAPAWAVSLGGVALVSLVAFANWPDAQFLTNLNNPDGMPANPNGLLTVTAAIFAVGSVAGGLVWLLPAVRSLSAAGDPGLGRRTVAALVGLGGSSLLAGLAGILQAVRLDSAAFNGTETQLLFALGAALLGGASLAGRGGGIIGTVLATFVLVGVDRLVRLHEGPAWAAFLLPVTIAIVVGILVSRLFDWLGTRPPAPAPVPADIASDGPDH
jgi:ribose/xylose/arabinose/galactoside ABC-type transport system permease subunit